MVSTVETFFSRSPMEPDVVIADVRESQMASLVNTATPVVLSTGVPYATDEAAGTRQVPVRVAVGP